MKGLLPISLIVLTAACVNAPTEPNPWAEKPRVSSEAVYPIEYPELAEDLGNLEVVLEAALGNYDIAKQNARELEELSRAYNAALDAGEAEHDLGQIRLRQLAEERRGRMWDKVQWLGLIGAAIAVGVTR